jgi:hypothetical protein
LSARLTGASLTDLAAGASAKLLDGFLSMGRGPDLARLAADPGVKAGPLADDIVAAWYSGSCHTATGLASIGIENFRDGSFRKDRPAIRIEIGNDGWSWPKGAPTWADSTIERKVGPSNVRFGSLTDIRARSPKVRFVHGGHVTVGLAAISLPTAPSALIPLTRVRGSSAGPGRVLCLIISKAHAA